MANYTKTHMVPASPGNKSATEESDILIFSTTAFTREYAAISHIVFLSKRRDSCLNSGTFIPDDKKKEKKKKRRTSEVDDTRRQNPPFLNSPAPPGRNATGRDKNEIKNSDNSAAVKERSREKKSSGAMTHPIVPVTWKQQLTGTLKVKKSHTQTSTAA